MSKADTMFEELGYKKVQDCSGLHYFRGEKYEHYKRHKIYRSKRSQDRSL